MGQEKKYDVFISYSRKDSAIADKICSAFDQAGITYFIDREGIKIEKDYIEKIAKEIDGSKMVLFLASATSYISKYVRIELQYAFDNDVLIHPYQIDNAAIARKYRMLLSGPNWYNINEHPINPTLITTIAEHVGKKINFDEINRPIESFPLEVKNVVNEKSIKHTLKIPKHFRLRKILLSVCLSLISIILVLGTSCVIACNTLRYEYDYSNLSATVVAKKNFFRMIGDVEIPSHVNHLGKVYTVASIGDNAFKDAYSLTHVKIPSSISYIGCNAFANCSSLSTMVIPNSVTGISSCAFEKCIGLTSVTIGRNIRYISSFAFSGCVSLDSIYYVGTIEQWERIIKGGFWADNVPTDVIYCVDGDVELRR